MTTHRDHGPSLPGFIWALLLVLLVLSAWTCGIWAIWTLGHWPWRVG